MRRAVTRTSPVRPGNNRRANRPRCSGHSRVHFQCVGLISRATSRISARRPLGLLPLLAEGSLRTQVLKPLVISVVFGLLASTVLVLLLIPALYSILSDLGLATVRTGSAA